MTITVKIPAAGGYYHIGDAFIYLAGCCLPFPCALIAGALGGAFADLFSGYAVYIIPTFIIKACAAAFFTNKKNKILCVRNFIAVLTASVITVAGYFTAYVILYGFAGALPDIYGNISQVVASAVIFIPAGAAVDGAGLRNRIFK